MGVVVWIVVAFVLGFLFGRVTRRSSQGTIRANTGASPAGPFERAPATPETGVQTSVQTTIEAPVSMPQSDVAALLGDLQGAYKVMLLDHGPNLINTIKAIRDVVRVDLKGAKDLAESTPCELLQVHSLDEGKRILQRFQGVASVRLDGGRATNLPPELERLLTEYAKSTAADMTKTT